MFNKKNIVKEPVSSLPYTKKELRRKEYKWIFIIILSILLAIPTLGLSFILMVWGFKKAQAYNLLKKIHPNTISRVVISDIGSKGDFSRDTEIFVLHNDGDIVKLIEAKEINSPLGKFYHTTKALNEIGASKPLIVTQKEFGALVGKSSFSLK